MNILDHIDPQALIILVVMIIGALRWFMENIRKKKGDPDEEGQAGFQDLYEEARRKILDSQQQVYPEEDELGGRLEQYTQPQPVVTE